MITFSDPHDKIVAGLFACDQNLGDLKKNATNPHFKSKYADLGATCEAIQPGLTAGKLLAIQAPLTGPDGQVGVETMIVHESGQWVRPDPLFLPLAKADPQGAGSAITYARRYALAAFFNLAPEDDDANAASKRTRTATAPAQIEDKLRKSVLLARAVNLALIPDDDFDKLIDWSRGHVKGCEQMTKMFPEQARLISEYFDVLEKGKRA